MTFVSEFSLDLIRSSRPDKVFLSAAGLDEEFGITCINPYEGPFKRALIKSAREKILLVDSSKFGRVEACYFGDFDQIDTIITDSNLDPDWIEKIREKNIKLIMV